ncbi:hypothetical protein EF912_21745 [Streptomyces sp. WAC07061]|uniref:hypothetical protein n=1 Tax=Streptomyces sp. WAC07061 TaxID=2487410 RepID=UPI000F7A2322|nr:hypothetical protein [Streptomyces sp. WAC07061]RSS50672.1 hypothetical protein EF912_21745 [Streptomyces sp. WAC07061]
MNWENSEQVPDPFDGGIEHLPDGTAHHTGLHSASDPTTITGGDCSGDGENGGSTLPINLNGVVTLFNNINLNSPNGSNNSNQAFGLNAP